MLTGPLLTSVLFLAMQPTATTQSKTPVDLDWADKMAGKLYSSTWRQWIKAHDLLVFDNAGKTGGFIDMDASTGAETHVGDTAAALASLKAVGGPAQTKLFPSDIVDSNGVYLAYKFEKGLYVLNLTTNSFKKADGVKPEAKDIRFSPDGNSIAFVQGNDLYAYSIPRGTTKRLTTNGGRNLLNGLLTWVYWEEIFNHANTAYWWSPDSRKIAYFETDESPVPPTTFVSDQPQYVATFTQCYPKPGNANPIVRFRIADTGQIDSVPEVEHQEYIVGVKWESPIKLMFQTYNRAQTEAKVNVYDGSAVETIVTDKGSWMDPDNDFALIDQGAGVLFGSGRTGFEHLYKAHVGSSDAPTELTAGAWQATFQDTSGTKAVAYLDKPGGWIYFVGNRDSYLQRNLYAVKTDGSGLRRISKVDGSHSVAFSADGRFYLDTYSNWNTPPTTSLNSADGTVINILDKPNLSVLDSKLWSRQKFFTIAARDGFKLPATILKPRNLVSGKRYPVIVEIYGGPEAPTVRDAWNTSYAKDQLLCEAGFIVLHVDNRSSTVIDQRNTSAVKGNFYNASERNDFIDAARWLKKQPFVDPNRIGITGWSGGGGNTLNCMCRSTEFKAGIAGAPYLDPAFYDTYYSEHLYGLKSEDPGAYERSQTWKDAKDLHGALLLAFGTGDDNVHNQHELNFLNECIAHDKLVQVMIYPMRKHGLGDPAANRHLIITELDFWKRNL